MSAPRRKTDVMHLEKVTLHHSHPLEGAEPVAGSVLIAYYLIGRYTMADLQEDRSLVRNLLGRDLDCGWWDGAIPRAPTCS